MVDAGTGITPDVRDKLLDELRKLAEEYSWDGDVRKPFAMGLSHTLQEAKLRGISDVHDELLEELQALSARHPGDMFLREEVVMAKSDVTCLTTHRDILLKLGPGFPVGSAVLGRMGLATGIDRPGRVLNRTERLDLDDRRKILRPCLPKNPLTWQLSNASSLKNANSPPCVPTIV
jgi:hypothetical protein